jgi:chlorite dismutase
MVTMSENSSPDTRPSSDVESVEVAPAAAKKTQAKKSAIAKPRVQKAVAKKPAAEAAVVAAAAEAKPTKAVTGKRRDHGKQAREINAMIRYTTWSVFKVATPLGGGRKAVVRELEQMVADFAAHDVVVRGWYDVSALRADADIVLWMHAETSDALQDAYHAFRRTRLGSVLEPVWSQMALHRPAEFNKSHVPAFLADEVARNYVCIYPFVRSYEWYLLDDDERRDMLVEHGQMGRDYPDVRANTVASFALGDYEWILAFEADELHRIVDLMRHLRASKARMHVREEIPFYTGRRRSIAELVRDVP